MTNYEILAQKFEFNFKNCIFLLKLPEKANIYPRRGPKTEKKNFRWKNKCIHLWYYGSNYLKMKNYGIIA